MNPDLAYNLIHRMNLGDALKRTAIRESKQGIIFSDRLFTYPEFDALANRVGRLMQSRGISRGDAVGVYAINSIEFLAIFFACARIGAALVPVNLLLTAPEVDYVLDRAGIKALFLDPMFVPRLQRQWPNQITIDDAFRAAAADQDGGPLEVYVDNEDAVAIMFTSGTTARPKGVILNHLNFYASMLSAYQTGFSKDLNYLICLPLFHVAGLVVTTFAIIAGAPIVLQASVRPEQILDAVERYKVSMIGLPATVWVGLLQAPQTASADLSSLRCAYVFQYMPTNIFQRWFELTPKCNWYNAWGQTETVGIASVTPPEKLSEWLSAPDPIGIAGLCAEVRIVDELMNDVPEGKLGELVVRGPMITPGYFEDPEANQALFYGGWHHTGDIGYQDANGSLYFADRKKDMIKPGGENVSSVEVEEALAAHPAISEVAVIGLPDAYWIEKVVAVVTLLPDKRCTSDELVAFSRERLAKFKVPKEIHIVDQLPKNPTGKILKRELRKTFEASHGAAG